MGSVMNEIKISLKFIVHHKHIEKAFEYAKLTDWL